MFVGVTTVQGEGELVKVHYFQFLRANKKGKQSTVLVQEKKAIMIV